MKSNENRKRKRRLRHKNQDLISNLSDDILIPIISHLNVKEAAATNILSSRWRYLHTYITRLSFPLSIFKSSNNDINNETPMIKTLRRDTKTVSRVLNSHAGIRVKEFRVHMHCLEGAKINRWLQLVFAKDVEIIHINMDNTRRCKYSWDSYSLPAHLNLKGESLICLKELSLSGIDVNDEEIQLLLHKFPFLESLAIKYCSKLRNVSIVGHSSSKLKHLDISRSQKLQLIEIDNFESLVSIWCAFNPPFSLKVKNAPKLSELSMSDISVCTSAHILSQMSSSIHDQLQTLKIFTDPLCTNGYINLMPPQLIGVKTLELQHIPDYMENWSFDPFYIIRACPSLEKLEVKFSFRNASQIKVNEDYEECTVLDRPKKKVCPNLTKMKISEFLGSSSELEYVFSILKHVNTLQELVVETCDENKKIRNLARDRAKEIFRLWALKVVVV